MKRRLTLTGSTIVLGLALTLLLCVLLHLGSGRPLPRVLASERSLRAQAPGDVYCVAHESGSYPGCALVFTSIQDAVDAAAGGEAIKVAAGTYSDVHVRPRQDTQTTGVVTQVVYIIEPLTLQGGYTTTNWDVAYPLTQPTTLDAQRQGRGIYIAGESESQPITVTIAGLRITGGDATGLGGGPSPDYIDSGGGLYAVYATLGISDSVIISNTSREGAGIKALWSRTEITSTVLTDNSASGLGGGLYAHYGEVTVWNSTFVTNTSGGNGGGMFALDMDETTVVSSMFEDNRIAGSYGDGGGLEVVTVHATVVDNAFVGNTAPDGVGGVRLQTDGGILSDNLVLENAAQHCGGMSAGGNGAGLTVAHNTVLSNTSQGYSGGVCLGGDITVTGNLIAYNHSQADYYGGGLYVGEAHATFIENRIYSNTIDSGYGGGLYIEDSTISFDHNQILSNTAAQWGGGISLWDSSATFMGDTIAYNHADDMGGGLYLVNSPVTMTNVLVHDNRTETIGSGMCIHYSSSNIARLIHSTIARNTGGDGSGILLGDAPFPTHATVYMTNTVLVSHTVGISVDAGNTAALEATLWGTDEWANLADWSGAGTIVTGTINVWGDPAFLDPDAGNYHLGPSSAAIDQGIDVGVGVDVDGEARPSGTGYDLGADEFRGSLALSQQASPDPAFDGMPLHYTIHLTNSGQITLHATVTDYLPAQVVPGGTYTWETGPLAPGEVWTASLPVTVEVGYLGTLTNTVQATSVEGASGWSTATTDVHTRGFLPLVLRTFP